MKTLISSRSPIRTTPIFPTFRKYDDKLFRLEQIVNDVRTTKEVNGLYQTVVKTAQVLQYKWDEIGNLEQRKEAHIPSYVEDFYYDALNRLTSAVKHDGVTQSVEYDALGNITYKSDVGTYYYGQGGNRPHAVSSIDTSTATNPISQNIFDPSGGYQYDANGNIITGGSRNISWSSFK